MTINNYGSELQIEGDLVEKLINAATNPRDKALVALLGRAGLRASEGIKLKTDDVDFQNGTLTIIHQKEKSKLKCPKCGDNLGKRHIFCPGCGNKVDKAVREKIEMQRRRTIPIDRDTLRTIHEYLEWRRKFNYLGEMVFPISRQRCWQLLKKLGRRAGIEGLHPHSLRHFLATQWVSKGLDVRKLQLYLGHENINTTMQYVDASFEQLRSEYSKLWDDNETEKTKK